jgi:hypothetical protein
MKGDDMGKFDGIEVQIGKTVEISSSSDFCWYPTIHQFPTGELLVTMRMCADETFPESEFSGNSISRDGGLTWSVRYPMGEGANIDAAYTDAPRKDGCILSLTGGYCAVEPDPVAQAKRFRTTLTRYARGGMEVNLIRDAVIDVQDSVQARPVKRPGEMKRTQFYELQPFGAIIEGNEHDLLSTAYIFTELDGRRRRLILLRSTDEGMSWHQCAKVAAIEPGEQPPDWWGNEGPCEACIVRTRDGRLLIVFRTGNGGLLGQTWSSDGGRTWSKPIPMTIRGVAPHIRLLSSGLLALSTGRPAPVSIFFSPDGNGEAWSPPTEIFGGVDTGQKGFDKQRSTRYTDFVEVEPGRLLLVYDSVPYGWEPVPPMDENSRDRILGTFIEVRKG